MYYVAFSNDPLKSKILVYGVHVLEISQLGTAISYVHGRCYDNMAGIQYMEENSGMVGDIV